MIALLPKLASTSALTFGFLGTIGGIAWGGVAPDRLHYMAVSGGVQQQPDRMPGRPGSVLLRRAAWGTLRFMFLHNPDGL